MQRTSAPVPSAAWLPQQCTYKKNKTSKFRNAGKHLVFCRGFRPKCFCNARKQIHLRRGWPQRGGEPNQGVGLLTRYVHRDAIQAQTPLLFSLLCFRKGLALCSGQAGSHSGRGPARLDGAAVRKSALRTDWKSMLGISCLLFVCLTSLQCLPGIFWLSGPAAAVLRHGIGAVGPLSRCQPAALQPGDVSITRT